MVFFGGSEFSIYVLDELKLRGILPELIITTPDKPKGRKLVLTPTPVKVWAKENNIEVIDPASLKKDNADLVAKLKGLNSKLFLVASYGKIIPKEIFEIPEYKTLNIHPSLLPKYRGASPIQSQILADEKEIGVTIMQIDEGMDHGPIVKQKKIMPLKEEAVLLGRKKLEKLLAEEGAKLFVEILSDWLDGKTKTEVQDENLATFCQKIEKENGELQIDLDDFNKNARENILKIKAFEEWPTAYFFIEKNGRKMRIIITDAALENGLFKILRVIPEGKKEMSFADFMRGYKN